MAQRIRLITNSSEIAPFVLMGNDFVIIRINDQDDMGELEGSLREIARYGHEYFVEYGKTKERNISYALLRRVT